MPAARARSTRDGKKPTLGTSFKTVMHMQMSPHPSKPAFPPAPARADREFDLWLERELSRIHGDVLHEPVPDRLLRIIEESVGRRD